MALTIEYATHYGINCENAHCIVRDARVNKEEHITHDEDGEEVTTTTFDINYNGKIFASADTYENGSAPIGGFNGRFELDAAAAKTQYNLVKQCYLNLKTMDGFTNGVDC